MNEYKKYEESKTIAKALKNSVSTPNVGDEAIIKEWMQSNGYAIEVMNQFANKAHLENIVNDYRAIEGQTQQGLNRLLIDIDRREQRRKRVKYFSVITTVAAALATVSMLIYNHDVVVDDIASNSQISNNISDKPYLVLGDGQKVDISSDNNQLEIAQVVDKELKMINYTSIPSAKLMKSSFHTLITPFACSYQIVLADGTEVILNSNSKLHYPTSFAGDKREVTLDGEAYFKVKKDFKPFIVKSGGVTTEVYGTEFNIQSFGDNIVKTILVSGSVGVRVNDSAKEERLRPNQMTTVDTNSGNITIKNVDVKRYTAWVDGCFRYDSEKIGNAIDEFSRWYGVEFQFTKLSSREEVITALFEKSLSLDKILLTIEKATTLRFIKKGGKYIVE